MTIWNECTMEYYPAEADYGEWPCVVKIEGSNIRLEWKSEGLIYVYEGKQYEDGHFKLTATTHEGRGTLHLFPSDLPDDAVLEGFYYEEKAKGMWRIILDGRVGAPS